MADLQVYSPQDNARLRYVLDYVLQQRCGLVYSLANDRSDLNDLATINYSAETMSKALTIDYSLYLNQLEDVPTFEKNLTFSDGVSSFDFLAAIFFLLARVEEYDTPHVDEHQRFQPEYSALYKIGCLDFPIIDTWIGIFKDQLLSKFGIQTKKEAYEFHSTIDIDHLYAFKHKPAVIKYGSMLKQVLTLQIQKLKDRTKAQDPYDRIEDMLQWHQAIGLSPLCFVLTAQRGDYDKSLAPNSLHFIQQIGELAQKVDIGIHPSYASNHSTHILKKEKNDLAAIIDRPLSKSRQHFLKLSFPETYRRLIEQGISEDYTMGYASQLGFRAGTSRPFYWYDLQADKATDLKVFPFQIMDVTLKNYLKLKPKQALEKTQSIIKDIKAVHGTCTIIWHNSSFYAAEGWAGWEEIYKEILSIATDRI